MSTIQQCRPRFEIRRRCCTVSSSINRPHTTMSNIDNYQQEVISYKTAGSTNAEILAWLENNGVSTSERTLERRLKAWGCNRNTKVAGPTISTLRSLPQCCGPTGKVNTASKMSFKCRAIVYRRDVSHTRAP